MTREKKSERDPLKITQNLMHFFLPFSFHSSTEGVQASICAPSADRINRQILLTGKGFK